MLQYKWNVLECEKDYETIDLGENLHSKIKQILVRRGIDTSEKFTKFINPHIKYLHSPWLMKDMERAVNRIETAINEKQQILVYGDYDVDGTTSIALVYSFLKNRGAQVDYYVPDRYEEGYGLSEKGVNYAIETGVKLIITLDCGIKDHNRVETAQKSGIDVIVTDHHNQGDTIPNAYAVLNPKRHDCEYPFKDLSGCGVGFKLCHALCERLNLDTKTNLYCYLDYVAISIAADIVPVVGENRLYMQWGLQKFVQKPLPSVRFMLERSELIGERFYERSGVKITPQITVSDIVFKIAPKINAAGRMGDARNAIKLLLATNSNEAAEFFEMVKNQNDDRKEKENEICSEALTMLKQGKYANRKSTVLWSESWNKGVVGIAAAKIIEEYYRPTIILCGNGDIISGSARSVEGFDLYAAIEKCSSLLTAFGGHTHAAGLSLRRENFDAFCSAFENAVANTILPEQCEPSIDIDGKISLDDVTQNFYNQLQKFIAPFGPQNMQPVFAVFGEIPVEYRYMGSEQQHLRLKFVTKSGVEVCAVGFGMAKKWDSLKPNTKKDICFTVSTNVFRGTTSIQLMLKDVRDSE